MQEETKEAWIGFWVLAALSASWMVGIFIFSGQTGPVSSSESDDIAEWLAERFAHGLGGLVGTGRDAAFHQVTWAVRKTAHMLEYAVLGSLLCATAWQATKLRSVRVHRAFKSWALSFAIGVAYAATDEFHQLFVPGRSGQVSDVCIDAIGIALGTTICLVIVMRGRRSGEVPKQNTRNFP